MGVIDDYLHKLDELEDQLREFGEIPAPVLETLHEFREDLEAHQLDVDGARKRRF